MSGLSGRLSIALGRPGTFEGWHLGSIDERRRAARRVTRIALLAVPAVVAAGILVVGVPCAFDYEYVYGLAPLFDLGREANVPTWLSSALLLLSGTALAVAGLRLRAARRPGAWWWLVLAAALCLASLDETANLHELLSRQARRLLQPGFGQLWVLLLGPPALAFMAVYVRFLARQDPRVSRAFAAGAALFVGGALGIEVVEIVLERRRSGELAVALTTSAQEIAELLGAVVLLHGSLTQLTLVAPVEGASRPAH